MQERRQSTPRTAAKKQGARRKAGPRVKSILELAAEARSLATQADWKKLPTDLSKHFDEYHYHRGTGQD